MSEKHVLESPTITDLINQTPTKENDILAFPLYLTGFYLCGKILLSLD